jgi:hypothetical protein
MAGLNQKSCLVARPQRPALGITALSFLESRHGLPSRSASLVLGTHNGAHDKRLQLPKICNTNLRSALGGRFTAGHGLKANDAPPANSAQIDLDALAWARLDFSDKDINHCCAASSLDLPCSSLSPARPAESKTTGFVFAMLSAESEYVLSRVEVPEA